MIHVKIDKEFTSRIDRKVIRDSVRSVFVFLGKSLEVEISIYITNDREIQRLNHEYRLIDQPTDVLAFPLSENDPETGQCYLGDIIISFQTAENQAISKGHSTSNEIRLLVVHGTLHLLDYDHHTPVEKEKMWEAQTNILSSMNLDAIKLSD